MATTPVKLKIEGKSTVREVATFSMMFHQATDNDGQVVDFPRGGKITMRLKALNSGNTDLVCWMLDPKQAYDGEIIFTNTIDNKEMKRYEFKHAYCVDYHEYWEDDIYNAPLAHWEEITISCEEINNGPMTFSYDWIKNSKTHYTQR